MLLSQQPIFKRFWYPTLAVGDLAAGPQAFRLLGQDIVLWQGPEGAPVAMEDRCPHRRAKLSVDSLVVDGTLRCGYHGWRFGPEGGCTLIPQQPDLTPGAKARVKTFRADARYGFVWVCLDDAPLLDIPVLPHSADPAFRQIFEYAEDWDANMLRVCENALDIGHISFVHRKTFGNDAKPASPRLSIVPMEAGVNFKCRVPVANRELQQKNLQIGDDETLRIVDIKWYLPGSFVLHFTYPNGLIHAICGFATPIDDGHIRRIQFVYRSDSEAEAPGEKVAEFDRSVAAEDRRMLESCDPYFPLDPAEEAHMLLDRPGLLMRRLLAQLIETGAVASALETSDAAQ
jgi:phenylpropionate dioxygenase-like ring-hydroxylating dioxygenase large terminal subunit